MIPMIPLERVLPPDSKSLIVPIDHGLTMGNVAGLEDPAELLQELAAAGVDGTLMSPGAARRFGSQWKADRRSLTITLDFQLLAAEPGELGPVRQIAQVSSVRQAVDLGADAVKALFVWGAGDELLARNVALIGSIAEEAHRARLPVMVEPLWFGGALSASDHEAFVVHAARIAFELGADILKVPVVEVTAVEAMLRWGAPVVFLGGPRRDEPNEMLADVRAGLAAGVSGIVIGRHVWQSPRMAAMLSELREAMGG